MVDDYSNWRNNLPKWFWEESEAALVSYEAEFLSDEAERRFRGLAAKAIRRAVRSRRLRAA